MFTENICGKHERKQRGQGVLKTPQPTMLISTLGESQKMPFPRCVSFLMFI